MSGRNVLAYAALLFCPFLFASNAIYGRLAHDIEPFTLAFLRWSIAGVILALLVMPQWPQIVAVGRKNWGLTLLGGWLGMWLAGGIVYRALQQTSATNGLLIYTLPPALVIAIEYFWRGRQSGLREWAGIFAAFVGVLWIMVEGQPQRLLAFQFNPGDLLFLGAAVGWAFYTLLIKADGFAQLSTAGLLCLIALTGAVILLPFMVWELSAPTAHPFPHTPQQWLIVAGIVATASIGSFVFYNFGVRVHGPSVASIFMYLLAPFGILEAWLFLGETMASYHWVGAGFVIGGVILATLPGTWFGAKADKSR